MKTLIVWLFCLILPICIFSQVEQIIYTKTGARYHAEYISSNCDTYSFTRIPVKKNNPITLPREDIQKVQTLGVHFLDDEYTMQLASNDLRLEYRKLCHTGSYGLHLSGRFNSDTITILMKLKFSGISKDDVYSHIHDMDSLIIELEDGFAVKLDINETYVLMGQNTRYDFGILKPNSDDIEYLMNFPISKVYVNEERCAINDPFCIMRMLLAIKEAKASNGH